VVAAAKTVALRDPPPSASARRDAGQRDRDGRAPHCLLLGWACEAPARRLAREAPHRTISQCKIHSTCLCTGNLCFFISGMAGLIYQIAWMRTGRVSGSYQLRSDRCVSRFHGWIAIGNASSGCGPISHQTTGVVWMDRAWDWPALWRFEMLAIATTPIIGLPGGGSLVAPPRCCLSLPSASAILLPTMLMGATLPVLTKFVTRALTECARGSGVICHQQRRCGSGLRGGGLWWIPRRPQFTVSAQRL
jgi:hypothetical protein